MGQISPVRVFLGASAGALLLLLFAVGVVLHGIKESEQRASEFNSLNSSPTKITFIGKPEINQRSIDIAMKLYAIRLPENVKGPFLSPSLEDRGLTVRKGVLSAAYVYVGPEAFTSWSLLGSTLAHEIEIHCRQNFLAIHFQNLSGFDGTGQAEREAYSYELLNADRFGLGQYDRDLIKSTMAYFYPRRENVLVEKLDPLRFWLDRLSASSFAKPLL